MRKIVNLLLVLAMVLSMTACSGSKTETPKQSEAPAKDIVTQLSAPVTIEFWHSIANKAHIEILDGLVKEFNETVGAEKGITVNATYQGP